LCVYREKPVSYLGLCKELGFYSELDGKILKDFKPGTGMT
jgi:hypothetical protein